MSRSWWIVLLGSLSCSGDPPGTHAPPEVCDDGADNDGDGLTDCDDGDCGGLACQTNPTGTDTGANLPIAEVFYSSDECCAFDFGPESCPELDIGTIGFINRSSSDDGVIDVSCNLVGGSVAAVHWRPDGDAQSQPFLTDFLLPADTELTVTGSFVCGGGVNQSFTTSCLAKVAVGVYEQEIHFDVVGTATSAP